MVIYCLGDSLTRGYGVLKGSDYPSQLQGILRGREVMVHNRGIDGQTTEELHLHVGAQLAGARPGDHVCLMIGSNDALGLRLPVEQYLRNVNLAAALILEDGLELWLATLPPIEAEIFFGEDPNRRLCAYNQQIRELAREKGVHLVEQAFLNVSLTTDGVHFGEEGYRQIARRWAEAFMRWLG